MSEAPLSSDASPNRMHILEECKTYLTTLLDIILERRAAEEAELAAYVSGCCDQRMVQAGLGRAGGHRWPIWYMSERERCRVDDRMTEETTLRTMLLLVEVEMGKSRGT